MSDDMLNEILMFAPQIRHIESYYGNIALYISELWSNALSSPADGLFFAPRFFAMLLLTGISVCATVIRGISRKQWYYTTIFCGFFVSGVVMLFPQIAELYRTIMFIVYIYAAITVFGLFYYIYKNYTVKYRSKTLTRGKYFVDFFTVILYSCPSLLSVAVLLLNISFSSHLQGFILTVMLHIFILNERLVFLNDFPTNIDKQMYGTFWLRFLFFQMAVIITAPFALWVGHFRHMYLIVP